MPQTSSIGMAETAGELERRHGAAVLVGLGGVDPATPSSDERSLRKSKLHHYSDDVRIQTVYALET